MSDLKKIPRCEKCFDLMVPRVYKNEDWTMDSDNNDLVCYREQHQELVGYDQKCFRDELILFAKDKPNCPGNLRCYCAVQQWDDKTIRCLRCGGKLKQLGREQDGDYCDECKVELAEEDE